MEDKKMAAPEVASDKPGISRRDFVSTALGASLMAMVPPGVRSGAWAAGSDAPEKKEVRIGFIPLTDCASVVMASVMKFDEKYGIKIIPTKEASWAAVRDKMVNGEIDAAHVLYGLIYGVQMGVGGPPRSAMWARSTRAHLQTNDSPRPNSIETRAETSPRPWNAGTCTPLAKRVTRTSAEARSSRDGGPRSVRNDRPKSATLPSRRKPSPTMTP